MNKSESCINFKSNLVSEINLRNATPVYYNQTQVGPNGVLF